MAYFVLMQESFSFWYALGFWWSDCWIGYTGRGVIQG